MQIHNYKFHWNLWLFILGIVLLTSYDAFAYVPNSTLTNNLSTNNFVNKLSINQKYIFNQNFNSTNHFEFNGFNITNISNQNIYTSPSKALGNSIQIAAGWGHTCAINSDNKLFCWGYNECGQLGDGTNTTTYTPTPVNSSGLLNGKSVINVSTASYSHTCAINSDYELFCWGRNEYGQLGDGTNNYQNTPTPVNSTGFLNGKAVNSVSAGNSYTCAINSDNQLFCWGNNDNGQLGDGTITNRNIPTPVNSTGLLNGKAVNSVTAGYDHTCAINSYKELFCWGNNELGQLGDGTDADKNIPTLISKDSLPNNEICNGIDDDLDGEVDEDFDVGEFCNVGIGACQRQGVKVCSNDYLSTVCEGIQGDPSEEICDGIDNNCDGQIDEGFTTISGTCYANSDIENIDECNPTDIVINNRCYNPKDYNKNDNEIAEKIQPLPAIVTVTTTPGKINILMQKFTITPKLKKKLQKKALKKLGIKNAKLKVYYSYIITQLSDSDTGVQTINEFTKKSKKKVIKKTVKKNQTVEKKLSAGTYKIEYKILIQTTVNKTPITVWGNQKSNKLSTPVNFSIPKK